MSPAPSTPGFGTECQRPDTYLQTEDKISAALADSLTIECEGGAILLRKGSPWAQPLDNPPEGYLCEYLNFELTRLIP